MSRLKLLAHVCLLLCALPLLLAATPLPACQASDYEVSYTECHQPSNTRDLIYYLVPDANCTPSAEYTPPANKYGLPCSISCPAGQYLPLGETQCAVCKAGTFSIGGGYREDTWYSWPSFFSFSRYYVNNNALTVHNTSFANATNSPQWSLYNGVLRSGHVNDSQSSIIELSVYVISSTAHVSFSYRVNAEPNFDGLQFHVDGVIWLAKTSYSPNFVTVTHALTPGFHVLRWTYFKDVSLSRGEDAAFIKMIEVGGIFFADEECEVCPVGYFSPSNGSTACQPCPANTYANATEGVSQCPPCASNEYSYSAAPSCTPRQPCTTDDWEWLNTTCSVSTGTRIQKATWLTPIVCDAEHYQLPADIANIPCGACTDGAWRNPSTQRCEFCPDGEFSTGGSVCQACPAGTVATKSFTEDRFNDWIQGSTTDCSGDCTGQGWVLHGSYMDSGVGHGNSLTSWFAFTTNLLTDGAITFNYQLICPSSQCSLELSATPGDRAVISAPTTTYLARTLNLVAGTHLLNFTFSKFGFINNRTDRAAINRIVITHAEEGGAVACSKCENGTVSSAESTHCVACQPGQMSNADNSACVACPDGTQNPTAGGTCTPCGYGTTANATRTGCTVTCMFNDGTRQYNLSALRNDSAAYGPFSDTQNAHQLYYINVCGMSPDMCYATKDTMIHSYACQQTTQRLEGELYEGMDIGSIFSWAPLNDTRMGVKVDLTHGTYCAASTQKDKNRATHITYVCDPTAGVGSPKPSYHTVANPTVNLVEGPTCVYNFEWKSLYACPVCDPRFDMGAYYSPCQQGTRVKSYYWLRSPPSCVGTLLADEVVSCSETNARCNPGTFFNDVTGQCEGCDAGSFSVGGGEHIMHWNPLPTRFTTSAAPWVAGLGGVESIGSGVGNTTLSASFQYVVVGTINFQYKVYSTQPDQLFTFTINGQERLQLRGGQNKLGWNTVGIPLTPGLYSFTWRFTNGVVGTSTHPRAGVVIKGLTLVGTDYHDSACTPCPAGFHSAANATACTACAIDRVSQGDAPACDACPEDQFALPRASTCFPRPTCTADDWSYWYGACTNGSRLRIAYYLEPTICVEEAPLPATTAVPCAACPPGTYRNPANTIQCIGCPSGQILSNGACRPVAAGSIGIPQQYFFLDASDEDELSLPEGWTTSCSGDCSNTADSNGWRPLANGALDSGYHSTNAVDVLLKFSVHVGDHASLSFDYDVVSTLGRNGLDLYTNNVFVASLRDTASYTLSLAKGGHNLTWNYFQINGTQGLAKISNIVLAGSLASNVGVTEMVCPNGTFSENGVVCTLCPAGTFANSPGSATCTPCEAGYYNGDSGATECKQCPAGSFSVSNGSTCGLCPPGTAAEAPGSSSISNCTQCPVGYYTGDYGTSTCKQCQGETYTESEGSTYCLSECRFSSVVRGKVIQFGLDAVDVYTFGVTTFGTSNYYINFCNASLAGAPCAPNKPSHACATEPTRAPGGGGAGSLVNRDWGSDFNFEAMHDTTQDIYSGAANITTFQVSFENGESTGCPNGNKRSMKFRFHCDVSKGVGSPTLVTSGNNNCSATFDWISIMGCPVCTDNDYATVYGQCIDGMKTAQRTRLVACNGKEVEAMPSQSCTGTVEFPLGVVFVVIGIILALIVVAVIVFVKNRKISAQYSRLKMQGAGGTELDASTDSIHNL